MAVPAALMPDFANYHYADCLFTILTFLFDQGGFNNKNLCKETACLLPEKS